MTYISGSTKQLLILLEAAYEAGWKDGCNPYDYEDFWEDYKKEYLTEYESDIKIRLPGVLDLLFTLPLDPLASTEEVRCGGCHMEISVCDCPRD